MTVNILDPELPFLASQAAVELDNLLNGTGTDSAAVRNLAKRLQASLPSDTATAPHRALLADTATISVLGQAINISRSAEHMLPISSDDELSQRTAEIAGQLSDVDGPLPEDKKVLKWARAFCLALSQCAAAYRRSEFEVRRPHPFRR